MDLILRRHLEDKLNRKFGSHAVLYSKYTPVIPKAAEREYKRLANAYMGILREELEAELPRLQEAYRHEKKTEAQEIRRLDSTDTPHSLTELMLVIAAAFTEIENRLIARTDGFGLRRRLENLAHLTRKLTVKEWKKAIKATLAIDIREDYYLGDYYVEQLMAWVQENVDLIKTIPNDTLGKMRDIVYDGYVSGKSTTEMVREIRRVYSVDRRRAQFIAVDQIAKLNAAIQKAQQQDAGIEKYIWTTVEDERVRNCHRSLNGKQFSWDEPPEMWYETKRGIVYTGRHCHPGQDFRCRCIGRPVFNRETLDLPVDEDALRMTVTVK